MDGLIAEPERRVDYAAGNGVRYAPGYASRMLIDNSAPIGEYIRQWRMHRRMSQLDLALEAEISTRHLSFLETGRARPSREMVLNLAERLRVPQRERNRLLLAAGFAPAFVERPIDSPELAAARTAIGHVLAGYMPYPALAVDRRWNLVDSNAAVASIIAGIAPHLLAPPINVLRLSLHPDGLAPRIANLPQWRSAIFARLREQIEASADQGLVALLDELRGLPGGETEAADPGAVIIPMVLESDAGRLSLIGMTTIFGTPVDISLSELAIEAFLPADAETAERLRKAASAGG